MFHVEQFLHNNKALGGCAPTTMPEINVTIGVIPLVIGWIYNRLPIVSVITGVTPRTARQTYWNRDWIYKGKPSTYCGLTMNGKGGSYGFKKVTEFVTWGHVS